MTNRRAVKGEYGYLKAQMKREIFKTALFFALAAFFLIMGIVLMKHKDPDITLSKAKNNLLTIGAVLFILPGAKFLVSTIMFIKALKYSCPPELKERIEENCKTVAYDLYLTAYDRNYPLYAAVCSGNEIAALAADKTMDENAAKEHILQILKKDGYKSVTVKIFKESDRFIERAGSMDDSDEAVEKGFKLRDILLAVSL